MKLAGFHREFIDDKTSDSRRLLTRTLWQEREFVGYTTSMPTYQETPRGFMVWSFLTHNYFAEI